MIRFCAVLLMVIGGLAAAVHADPVDGGEAEVRQTLAGFIQAFDNLDWETFRAAFADNATVFYPRQIQTRADGRAEFEKFFQQVFESIRAGKTKGPYMNLQPRDLKVQLAGDVAIATFFLDDRPGFLNRRTIVFKKQANAWKIIHLHASEIALPPDQQQP